MDIPVPKPAQVIRYAYLWADEHEAGREEGSKNRPVAIVRKVVNPLNMWGLQCGLLVRALADETTDAKQ